MSFHIPSDISDYQLFQSKPKALFAVSSRHTDPVSNLAQEPTAIFVILDLVDASSLKISLQDLSSNVSGITLYEKTYSLYQCESQWVRFLLAYSFDAENLYFYSSIDG